MKTQQRRRVAALVAATLATAGLSVLPGTTAWATARTVLPGTAVVLGGADDGPVPPTEQITAQVQLAGDRAGLAAYARAVSDPHDPRYGHYLTPDQARARFGPTPAQTRRVKAWLRLAGLTVTGVTRHAVLVSGSASAVRTAFGTGLENYRLDGTVDHAPLGDIAVPSAVAPDVLSVTGLTTAPTRPGHGGTDGPATRATVATSDPAPSDPCPASYGEATATELPAAFGRAPLWAPCGYTPAQLRGAYAIDGTGLTGAGTTVAVVINAEDPTAGPDAARYAAEEGEPPYAPGQFTTHVQPGAVAGTGDRESAMDIEAVHAMAPAADIVYVVGAAGPTGDDPYLNAVTDVVDDHLADVVSASWGDGLLPGVDGATMDPALIAAYEQLFQQGAVEGITFNFASGDGGALNRPANPALARSAATRSANDDPSTPGQIQYPASSPWVTAVGGTSLAVGRDGSYLWETSWETDTASLSDDGSQWAPTPPGTFQAGAGGGTSTLFAQPSYQRSAVPAALATPPGAAGPMRTVPDVAAFADDTIGLRIGYTDYDGTTWTHDNYGGTSLSTPLLSGVDALIVQARHGVRLGFANPAYYARAQDFRDVTDTPPGLSGTPALAWTRPNYLGIHLSVLGRSQDSGLWCGPGYDTTTGLGSPTRALIDSFRTDPAPGRSGPAATRRP